MSVRCLSPRARRSLIDVLAPGRVVGAIGPGPLEEHVQQALGYVVTTDDFHRAVDLGTGGGVPGLPLALLTDDVSWVFVEASARRAASLRRQVHALELGSRVQVRSARAEDAGRGELRGVMDLVTARSFGPAAVTLECAAPLLRCGGQVVISVRGEDPPWPREPLDELGLGDQVQWSLGRFVYRAARAVGPCGDRYPRRAGRPTRDPLF